MPNFTTDGEKINSDEYERIITNTESETYTLFCLKSLNFLILKRKPSSVFEQHCF